MKLPDDKRQAVLQRALEPLQRTTGIHGQVLEREPLIAHGLRADARVEIEANGQRNPYLAEIKNAQVPQPTCASFSPCYANRNCSTRRTATSTRPPV